MVPMSTLSVLRSDSATAAAVAAVSWQVQLVLSFAPTCRYDHAMQ